MLLDRRSLLTLAAAAAPSFLSTAGQAQPAIPDKGIRLLVGFGSGNGTDVTARLLAPQLERRVGRHITVENRPGVSGATAGEAVKNGPGDGSMLTLLPSTTMAGRLTAKDYPFDPLVDVTPVTLIGRFPLAIAVSPKIGVSTFEEYLAFLKGDPANRRLGSTALSDAFVQLYGKMVSRAFGAEMIVVGFRGGSSMIADLEQGRLPAAISNLPTLLSAHRGGRAKIVLLTGDKRSAAARTLPTAADVGLQGLELREWYAFFTSAKAPVAAVDAWNGHIRALLEAAGPRVELTQLGLDVEGSTSEEMRGEVYEAVKQWKARLDSYGIPLRD